MCIHCCVRWEITLLSTHRHISGFVHQYTKLIKSQVMEGNLPEAYKTNSDKAVTVFRSFPYNIDLLKMKDWFTIKTNQQIVCDINRLGYNKLIWSVVILD